MFVRVNAEPELQKSDAEAACRAGAFGLFIAKASSPEQVRELAEHMGATERELGRDPLAFVALLEDAGAVLDARPIAACKRVLGLVAGGEDIATSMGLSRCLRFCVCRSCSCISRPRRRASCRSGRSRPLQTTSSATPLKPQPAKRAATALTAQPAFILCRADHECCILAE